MCFYYIIYLYRYYIMHCLGCAIYLPTIDDILQYFNLDNKA